MHCPECDIHSAKTIRITVEKFNWWMIRIFKCMCVFWGIAILYALWNVGSISGMAGRYIFGMASLTVSVTALIEGVMWAGRK